MSTPSRSTFHKGFVLLLLALLAGLFVSVIADFILALMMAAIFAALLHPLYLRTKPYFKDRETPTAIALIFATVLVVFIPLLALLGVIAGEALDISKIVVPWIEEQINNPIDLSTRLPEWLPLASELEPYKSRILSKLSEFAGAAGSFLVGSISDATQGTVGFLLSLFIMLYAMFYFLVQGPSLINTAFTYLPLREDDRARILDRGVSVTRATLKSILVIGFLQGVMVAGAFAIIGIEGAAFWGAIVMVLSSVPSVGPPLVWVPAAIYLLLTDQIGAAIGLIIWGVVVVGAIDNLLRPRLLSEDTKMPDVLILVSTLGGISFFGALGILLGPMLAAALMIVLDIYRATFKDALPDDPVKGSGSS